MNSRVSVETEDQVCGEEDTSDPPEDPTPASPQAESQGSVVLVIPPKETSEDCMPLMVNGVPVYISHTNSGSPLYIRQYPPTLDDIMLRRPEDLIPNFDGFSDASGQTFEGFSEGSSSSVLFEGFSEDAAEVSNFSIFQNAARSATDDDDLSLSRRRRSEGGRRPSARSKDRAGHDRHSRSSASPRKRTKQEKEDTPHSSAQAPNKRRQSTDKKEKDSLDCLGLELSKKPRHLPSPDDPDYIGEQCNDIGCTVSFLERMAIKEVQICNGVVKELSDFARQIMWDKEYVIRWIQRLSGVRTEEPVENGDLKSIQAVLKRRKALATIHSGNQYLKIKLKSFDNVEFVLPSVARRKGTGHSLTLAAGQSTDDETYSESEPAVDLKPHAMIKNENNQETRKEGDEKQGKARRGVKRGTQENENKRQLKGRRISKEINQNEEENIHKTEEKEVIEGEHQETLIKTEEKTSDRNRQRSTVSDQVKDEGPQTLAETDPTKTSQRRISTRRTSTMTVKEEKETQPEEAKQGTDRSRRHRRASTAPQGQQHDDGRAKSQDKKKHQHNQENNVGEDFDLEEERVIKTETETPARLRASTRRASVAQEKPDTADETKQIAGKTKGETSGRNRGADNRTKLEKEKQDHNHKAKELSEVAKDEKKQNINENTKPTNMEIQITGAIKTKKRISTRRASMLALQEEKQRDMIEKEAEREKQSRKRGTKEEEEEEEIINQVKETDTNKQENQADIKIEKETPRNRRTRRGSLIVKQEEEIVRNRSRRISLAKVKREKEDKEIEKGVAGDAKEELEETDKDDSEPRQATEKTGRYTKNKRSRKGSVIVSKGKEKEITDKDKTKEVNEDAQSNNDTSQNEDTEQDEEMEGKTKFRIEGETDEEDKPTSHHREKQDTEQDQENQLNESLDSDDNQVILKRNKVINKDKRISRWQNRKLRKDEEQTSPGKEEADSEYSQLEEMANDDLQSEDSDGNLMIDEGDSVLSELSESTHTGEGDSIVENEPSFTTPRKKRSLLDSEKERRRKTNQTEGSTRKTNSSPGKIKEIEGKVNENQDMGSMETPPLDTTTPSSTEPSQKPHGTGSSYDGTLGISKSGRLRKASAKGIQSIEIKCLFMQRNSEAPRPPPPLPVLKDDGKDKDWIREKRSPMKYERKDLGPGRASPVKYERREREQGLERTVVKSEPKDKGCSPPGGKVKRSISRTNKPSNEFTTYTYKDGHLVPMFKETNCYLGDYCAEAGLTVDDLNSDGEKDVRMTFGMIKELHEFYTSRKATKTSLAIRLFKMKGREILDNTHLLSTVIRLTSVAAIRHTDTFRLKKEFLLPVRIGYSPNSKEEKSPVQIKREVMMPPSEASPKRVRKTLKKRGAKPEDSGDEEYYSYADEAGDNDLTNEVLLTCGSKGSITRGDIVHLYTKWLKNKMSLGSNTFVTDLLRSVEELMAERCIAPIRIPAGTLMSSSVKLHDEYKQIQRISKEDAIMYLQEDWLEDIKYLLSISGPSRRSTTEAEGALASTGESDASTAEKQVKTEAMRHHSEGSKEEKTANFKVVPLKKTKPLKKYKERASLDVPRSHQMESVGKRKRRSVRKSLDEYERDILHEIEKVGMLEEDEEDMLSQLDQEKIESDFIEEQKERDKWKKKDEKGHERITNRDMREVSSPRKEKRPTKDGDLDIEKIMDFQEIHDSRGKKHLRYLVRWAGRGSEEDSWLDESNMSPSLVDAFWKKKKKNRKSDIYKPAVRKDRSSKKADSSAAMPAVREPRESEENIIQVMVKHGSAQHAANASVGSSLVTKRELLSLYDSWRQENQEELMAGGSNTVNVEMFKNRVRCLMAIRNITFHPESLLHACFMMTLMKTRLQSKMAIDKFLDTSCLEVLESSHRQYLKRKYSQVKEAPDPSNKHTKEQNPKEQSPAVLSLQNELHSLKLDLTSAQKWKAVKNSQLGAVEEEVDYLEAAMNVKKSEKASYLQQELSKLKSDIKVLEKYQKEGAEGKAPKGTESPLFDDLASDQENYKRKSKVVRSKLMNMNIPKATVNTIMDVLARRVSNQLV
uniref:Chromo domain-containing protein n=2 Tax=Scylla olivacea TaxID=85551 RepID=A0A0P4W759_SCYOL